MLGLRHQLPVWSPITVGALLGVGSALLDGSAARRRLEAILAEDYDAEQVVLTGTGTQALQLGIELALRGRDGPRAVALPAFSCYDVASAAVGANCEVTLYDLEPRTLAPDPKSLEHCLARGNAAVVVVAALYGVPGPWEELEAVAARYGATLVEDAAQGHGARWKDRRLGSLGPIGVLSFGRGKGWTGGGGGALLLRRGPAPALPLGAAGSGAGTIVGAAVQWALARPGLYGIPAGVPALRLGETVYHDPVAPTGISGSSSALALATRGASEAEAEARRRNGDLLREGLRHSGVKMVEVPRDGAAGWLRFPIRVSGGLAAMEDPIRALRLGMGRTYPTVLADLPILRRRLKHLGDDWPGARVLVRDLVTLPTHSRVTEQDRRELIQIVRQAAARQMRARQSRPFNPPADRR